MTDVNGDGVINAYDTQDAIRAIVLAGYGKVVEDEEAVSEADVLAVLEGVAEGAIDADTNLDGVADGLDVIDVVDVLGEIHSQYHVHRVTSDLWEYVGVIRTRGEAYFAASECAPPDHAVGVSMFWPKDHPRYWPPNHLGGVSQMWETRNPVPQFPEVHNITNSAEAQYAEHHYGWSEKWPANHETQVSWTWGHPPGYEAPPGYRGPTHADATSENGHRRTLMTHQGRGVSIRLLAIYWRLQRHGGRTIGRPSRFRSSAASARCCGQYEMGSARSGDFGTRGRPITHCRFLAPGAGTRPASVPPGRRCTEPRCRVPGAGRIPPGRQTTCRAFR